MLRLLFPMFFPLFLFSVDTDVDADVDTAGCQGALMGSRGETKRHLSMEDKWKQEDPGTHEWVHQPSGSSPGNQGNSLK